VVTVLPERVKVLGSTTTLVETNGGEGVHAAANTTAMTDRQRLCRNMTPNV